MSTTRSILIHTVSGRSRRIRSGLDPSRIVGLDADGRIVVNDFDAFNPERASRPAPGGIGVMSPFLFGLTLCCNASDKGVEDGVVCRACYGTRAPYDEGNYLFMNPDRTYDFDPADRITVDGAAIDLPVIPADALPVSVAV